MRPGGKKMVLVGAVNTIVPFPRTPREVLAALFPEPLQAPEAVPSRLKPCFKRARACLQRDEADSTKADPHGFIVLPQYLIKCRTQPTSLSAKRIDSPKLVRDRWMCRTQLLQRVVEVGQVNQCQRRRSSAKNGYLPWDPRN